MADISEFNINSTSYNLKDKILRDAELSPISLTTEDLPSAWGTVGTGFFKISTSDTLLNQPAEIGFLYNLVDKVNDENEIDIAQIFYDYKKSNIYTRGGINNISENIDQWQTKWIFSSNENSSINRVIEGLDINNYIYTDETKHIIRVADDANTPIIKLQEINDSETGFLTAQLITQRSKTNQEGNAYNYFNLNLDENGYATYGLSNPKEFRNTLGATTGIWPIELGGTGASTSTQAVINLGALPLSGGTLTGLLSISTEDKVWSLSTNGESFFPNTITIKNNEISANSNPEEDSYPRVLLLTDKDDADRGHLALWHGTGGQQGLLLEAQREVNDSEIYHTLRMTINSDGTRSVYLSDQAAWLSGLGTSKITYGTGGLTGGSSSLATGTVYLQYE